jgi:hypothetical protein
MWNSSLYPHSGPSESPLPTLITTGDQLPRSSLFAPLSSYHPAQSSLIGTCSCSSQTDGQRTNSTRKLGGQNKRLEGRNEAKCGGNGTGINGAVAVSDG